MEVVMLKPIGRVVEGMPLEKEAGWSRWKNPSIIEVFDEYVEGLKGLEEYSHVYIIYFMHLTGPFKLSIHPRRRTDMPEVGVFASRGPSRPNPIGLSVCRLLEVGGKTLKVLGLDAYTDTPILDIKPYDFYDIVQNPKVPEWFRVLWSEREESPDFLGLFKDY